MTEPTYENVINMDKYVKTDNGSRNPGLLALLNDCRDQMTDHLLRSLSSMMDRTDDALFDMAEKAESNVIQTIYFDAMREVRIKRKDIESGFKKNFLQECNETITRKEGSSPGLGLLNDEDTGMSLLGHEDMEESLAVSNMVSKANNLCKEELAGLNKRMGFLLGDPEFEKGENPLGPTVVSNAFKNACEVLDVDHKVKLIVLKLFDQQVIVDMSSIYHEINQYLVKNDVLPHITLRVKKNPMVGYGIGSGVTSRVLHESTHGPDDFGAEEQDLFSVFKKLFSTDNVATGISTGGDQPGENLSVLNALTMLQQQQFKGLGDPGIMIDTSSINQGTANVLRTVKSASFGGNLGHLDDMTIEIVAMLFDYIFDDKDVPDVMKVLIGRLQIPVLKVAIMDKSFFSKKSHPARRLVNDLAHACIGWNEENYKEDEFYNKVEYIVGRIQAEFEESLDLFELLLEEFEQYLDDVSNKAGENVEKSTRLLKGREKLEYAKMVVQDEIKRRISNEGVSEIVRVFLEHHWKNLLLVVHVTDGGSSVAWERGLNTMDDLVWSVLPKKTEEDKKKLVGILPFMLARLRDGMEMISLPVNIQEQFLTRLASCHGKAINEFSNMADDLMKQEIIKEGSEENILFDSQVQQRSIQTDDEINEIDKFVEELLVVDVYLNSLPESDKPLDMSSDKREAIMKMVANGEIDIEEVTLSDNVDAASIEIDDLYTDIVKDLSLGAWVEFNYGDDHLVRERLSWVSSVTGVYMFTDRQGRKTSQRKLYQLAKEFREGSAFLIEDVPLFDKAVSGLMHTLRNL